MKTFEICATVFFNIYEEVSADSLEGAERIFRHTGIAELARQHAQSDSLEIDSITLIEDDETEEEL